LFTSSKDNSNNRVNNRINIIYESEEFKMSRRKWIIRGKNIENNRKRNMANIPEKLFPYLKEEYTNNEEAVEDYKRAMKDWYEIKDRCRYIDLSLILKPEKRKKKPQK
jgi:hypothetical protein